MKQFGTHNYAVKSLEKPAIKSARKADYTPEQQAQIEQYKSFVTAMNKWIDSKPFEEVLRNVAMLHSQNQKMNGLPEDGEMLMEIEDAVYEFIDNLVNWTTDGDGVSALEKQWGLPEGALDY